MWMIVHVFWPGTCAVAYPIDHEKEHTVDKTLLKQRPQQVLKELSVDELPHYTANTEAHSDSHQATTV